MLRYSMTRDYDRTRVIIYNISEKNVFNNSMSLSSGAAAVITYYKHDEFTAVHGQSCKDKKYKYCNIYYIKLYIYIYVCIKYN